jgi:hypothetical protein
MFGEYATAYELRFCHNLAELSAKFIAGSSVAVISVALAIGMPSWCPVELEEYLDRRRKKPPWTMRRSKMFQKPSASYVNGLPS